MGFLEDATDIEDFVLGEYILFDKVDIGQSIYLYLLKLPIGVF